MKRDWGVVLALLFFAFLIWLWCSTFGYVFYRQLMWQSNLT